MPLSTPESGRRKRLWAADLRTKRQAALIWRCLAANPARAVAVGLGAGAFEAVLLGLGAFAGSLGALAGGQGDMILRTLAGPSSHTPLLWLTGPTERVIAISCQTAARVLVLRAVAAHRWLGFWAGFAWLSALDLLAGVALLTGMTTSRSLWLAELMILPLGALAVPLTSRAIKARPESTTSPLLAPESGGNARR